jgi:hypothetical protein
LNFCHLIKNVFNRCLFLTRFKFWAWSDINIHLVFRTFFSWFCRSLIESKVALTSRILLWFMQLSWTSVLALRLWNSSQKSVVHDLLILRITLILLMLKNRLTKLINQPISFIIALIIMKYRMFFQISVSQRWWIKRNQSSGCTLEVTIFQVQVIKVVLKFDFIDIVFSYFGFVNVLNDWVYIKPSWWGWFLCFFDRALLLT